ncbi:MAG: hypothetical protein HUK40_18595 [Desulfobacter sp.]|nr:hypothetical protein [Desulfobacter sp.]WDP85946.1 MAG: hypothetical protein HUN05_13025 [Desulfobacter sp.]
MPWLLKIFILYPILCSLLGVTTPNPLWAKGFAGIKTYYIRLDIKHANHKTIKSQLTMTPAETGADPENFSIIPLSHVVSATPQDSNATLEARAKKMHS